jgi:hypothetical protein
MNRSPNHLAVKNRLKTHCPHGHPYDEENTRMTPHGGRACRACNRAASNGSENGSQPLQGSPVRMVDNLRYVNRSRQPSVTTPPPLPCYEGVPLSCLTRSGPRLT